jgi:hypothetical protein
MSTSMHHDTVTKPGGGMAATIHVIKTISKTDQRHGPLFVCETKTCIGLILEVQGLKHTSDATPPSEKWRS